VRRSASNRCLARDPRERKTSAKLVLMAVPARTWSVGPVRSLMDGPMRSLIVGPVRSLMDGPIRSLIVGPVRAASV
jgi:hypothetical protein